MSPLVSLMVLRFGAVTISQLKDNNGPNAAIQAAPRARDLRAVFQLTEDEAKVFDSTFLDLNESVDRNPKGDQPPLDTFRVITSGGVLNLSEPPQDLALLEKTIRGIAKILVALPNLDSFSGTVDDGARQTPFQLSGWVLKAKFLNSLATMAERYGYNDILLKYLDPAVPANVLAKEDL